MSHNLVSSSRWCEWRKSSKSDAIHCVEVRLNDNAVLMRDSKDPAGPVLRFDTVAWSAFIAQVATSRQA